MHNWCKLQTGGQQANWLDWPDCLTDWLTGSLAGLGQTGQVAVWEPDFANTKSREKTHFLLQISEPPPFHWLLL